MKPSGKLLDTYYIYILTLGFISSFQKYATCGIIEDSTALVDS